MRIIADWGGDETKQCRPDTGRYAVVFFNGEKQEMCTGFDTETGWLRRLDWETGEPRELCGVVEVYDSRWLEQ